MFPFRCICVDPWVWGEIVEIVMHFNYGYMCCCMYMGDSLQWAVWVCVLGEYLCVCVCVCMCLIICMCVCAF